MDIDGDVDIFAAGAITVVCSLLVAHRSGARLYGDDLSCIFKLCVRKLGMIICSRGRCNSGFKYLRGASILVPWASYPVSWLYTGVF